MPYKTGMWGEQARVRSKKRLKYFLRYQQTKRGYEYKQVFGVRVPKEINLTPILKDSKCQLCGSINKLLIHHKDKNINNNNLANLILICRSCHNKIHKINNKYGRANYGRRLTEEHKRKISNSIKGKGHIGYWKGKEFSVEHREKMAIAKRKYWKRKRGELE